MVDLARLWAPWRSGYVVRRSSRRCIFCAANASSADRQHHVVARGRQVFALLNRYPYSNGHVMIAPYRHVGTLESLRPSEWAETLRLARRITTRLRAILRPHGFNVGLNVGQAAGAGFPGHLHLHLVPRWNGDTNFMPVLAHAKIVSQSLDELYTLLKT